MVFAKPSQLINCFLSKIPGILLGIFALSCVVLSLKAGQVLNARERELIAPPKGMEHFVFGYSESVADILWIRSLQDFDYCEKQIAENRCMDNSWLFDMLNMITNLSPHFRMPYAAGGIALTVIISDIDGATKIFDKGVKVFPNDWPLLYRAAYHYLYEVKDKKRAAELLIQAGENGAPPWVFTLAGRLYSDAGHLELAESLLQEMIQTKQDPSFIKRLQDKINSMKNADSSK